MTKDQIKTMLFGNQRQANSINNAVVDWMADAMQKSNINTFEDLVLYLEQHEPSNINIHRILLGETNIKLLQSNGQLLYKKNSKTGKVVFTVVAEETVKAIHKVRKERANSKVEIVQKVDTLEEIEKVLQPLVPTTIQKELSMNVAAQCLFAAPVYFGGMT